jgi:tyrosyl-tRNA synthetase
MEQDFKEEKLHPGDLKKAVAEAIIALLDPIQKEFNANEAFRQAKELAYPELKPEPVKKKKEKVYHPPPPGKGKNTKAANTSAEIPQDGKFPEGPAPADPENPPPVKPSKQST